MCKAPSLRQKNDNRKEGMKMKKMSQYLVKYPRLFAAYIIALAADQAVIISIALFLKYIIDAVTAVSRTRLVTALYVTVAYAIVLFLVEWIRRHIGAKYMYKTMLRLKTDVFSHILDVNVTNFDHQNSAQYISILSNDINTVETNYITAFFTTIQYFMQLIIAVILLLWMNPAVGIIACLLSAIPLAIPKIYGTKLSKLQGEYLAILGKMTEKMKDFLEGFEVIKTFGVEKNVEKTFADSANMAEKGKYRYNKMNADANAFTNMIGVAVQFFIFIVTGFFVLRGNLTVGAIVAVTQLSANIVEPIVSIAGQRTLMKSTGIVNERVLNIINHVDTNHRDKMLPAIQEGITMKNVGFSYTGEKQNIKQVSYTFQKGGKYAIVGGSGSGKSTMLKLLMGYYDQYEGAIQIDQTEIRDINRENLYQMISMMHQSVFLFDDTLKNNITLYNQYADSELENAVKGAGLTEVINALPEKSKTLVGESGKTLSGGERQRIAIARALLKGCKVLILDEATANLDNETAYSIEKSLLSAPDLTCLFVTHRYNKELLSKCDGILVMRDGELVESGRFETIYNAKGYFYSLLNVAEN
jgi:ATP-binding cassette subfamily C protein